MDEVRLFIMLKNLKSFLEAYKLRYGNDKISLMFSKDSDGESFIAVLLPKFIELW